MKINYYKFLLLFLLPIYTFAKGGSKLIMRRKAAYGLLPGSLVANVGFSRLTEKPALRDVQFWGSKFFNIYYAYELHLGKSNFTVRPGVGLGLEGYRFNNNPSIEKSETSIKGIEIKKIKFYTNYVDFPLEVRFNLNHKTYRKKTFVALGGKVGILFNNHTKVKVIEKGQRVKTREQRKSGVNPVRYGVYANMGVGRLGLFYSCTLSPLFEKGKERSGCVGEKIFGKEDNSIRTQSIGLSFAFF